MGTFHTALSGGPKRRLRNEAVIEAVLDDPARVDELFRCVLSDDEYVRLRASDALEKVCRHEPAIVAPLTARILADMSGVDQASVQWHFAQIVTELPLTQPQRDGVIAVLKRNLARTTDWIVITLTLQALAVFAKDDPVLRAELLPQLETFMQDRRPAVAKRAHTLHHSLQ